jgi:hypothetical protein
VSEVRSERVQRGFFHSMVVMGGAIAVGCGGISSGEGRVSGGSGSGSGGGGGGGSGGGAPPNGGTSGSPPVIMVGGAGQAPVEPGPFACSPAQIACSTAYSACHRGGFQLPDDCFCDDDRPLSPADCSAGERFVCKRALANASGTPFTAEVKFDCLCVPDGLDCLTTCSSTYGSPASCFGEESGPNGTSLLCGCAVIVLR